MNALAVLPTLNILMHFSSFVPPNLFSDLLSGLFTFDMSIKIYVILQKIIKERREKYRDFRIWRKNTLNF